MAKKLLTLFKNPATYNQALIAVFFIFALLLFIYKLDYHYFFTDEILYVQDGKEHLSGVYEGSLQVPLLPKYFAGALYLLFSHNAFLLRLPYAFMGVASAYLVFLILKKEYGNTFGLVGSVLFITSKIIFDSSRMVMLEPMMHLFWLSFHYFFYQTLFKQNKKLYIFSGIFLGLAIGTKITSAVFLPFIFLIGLFQLFSKKVPWVTLLKDYFLMFAAGVLSGLIFYIDYFIKLGVVDGLLKTARAVKDVYMKKSDEGKIHVINNTVYQKSPYWTYIYYFVSESGLFRPVLYVTGIIAAVVSKKIFVWYWTLFAVTVTVFLQTSGVKNVRYLSSAEIPLIFVVVSGLYYLLQKNIVNKYYRQILLGLLAVVVIPFFTYIYMLKPTEYKAAFDTLKKGTQDFTKYERLYVFGSIRSSKWYRAQVPDESMLLYRRDYPIMCREFKQFRYIAFDREELLKMPENMLHDFVMENRDSFDESNLGGMEFFVRKPGSTVTYKCPVLEGSHDISQPPFVEITHKLE